MGCAFYPALLEDVCFNETIGVVSYIHLTNPHPKTQY